MWAAGGHTSIDSRLIDEFTRRTGIVVRVVPATESSSHRFNQELALLVNEPTAVDVYQIDPIWVARLAPYLMDVRSQVAPSARDELPEVVENATFNGRVVAVPMMVSYGLLYYRRDLLNKYGFSHPPKTWDELGTQARRIQTQERAAGNKDFWGYVWQGASYEGLTCNALEWQSSAGGGNFVTADRRANAANPATVRAFHRAASWVGTISPPGVTAYVEEDSRNVWQSGHAAFLRNWGYVYALAEQSPEVRTRFAVAPLPSDNRPKSTAMGGWYLGVAAQTRHGADALAFVTFMTSLSAQTRRTLGGSLFPTLNSVYSNPQVQHDKELFSMVGEIAAHAVRRPAAVVGASYSCLSRVYADGVHDIITGTVTAESGSAALNARMQQMLDAPSQDCQ
jgi:trehalose/maltose transport system substrate-binding protein